MENLVEKLQEISKEFSGIENPTVSDINNLKQKEFDLFGEISTIRELCQYYLTDMTIDGMPQEFISGMYSGTVNGAMFVVNQIRNILTSVAPQGWNDSDTIKEIEKKLELMQGVG